MPERGARAAASSLDRKVCSGVGLAPQGRRLKRLRVSTQLRFSRAGNVPSVILNSLSTLHGINCFRNDSPGMQSQGGLAASPGCSLQPLCQRVSGVNRRKRGRSS